MKITIQPEQKKVRRCPNCHSTNIMGYGMIIGYGWINPDLSVDEPSDEWELYSDPEDLEYTCRDCNHEWEG